MILFALQFSLWLIVWIGLSWPVTTAQVVMGIFAASFVAFMTIDIFKSDSTKEKKTPVKGLLIFDRAKRFLWFLYYAATFIWECLKANFDVAFRVLHPDLPIRPGTVKVKTALTSDIALTFLANSITLTPGTTTVDIDKNNGYLYVHSLYMKEMIPGTERKMAIVEKFEKILKRIFE